MSDASFHTRVLDSVERFWFLRGEHGGAICVAVAIVDGPLDRAGAQRAAAALVHRHPILSARIADDRDPRFAPIAEMKPPLSLVRDDDPAAWQALAERELATPFDTAAGPLWRLTIASPATGATHTAVLAIHHSIVDGHSCFRILRDFFELCGDAPDTDAPVRQIAPLPPLAELLSLTPRKPGTAPPPRERTFPVLGRAPREQRRTRILAQTIAADRFAIVQQRLRAERTTVHSALCVASLIAAEATVGSFATLQLVSPVSLRPLCNPSVPDENIGCYATGLPLVSAAGGPGDFWARTRAYHRDLYAGLKAEGWRIDSLATADELAAARDHLARLVRDDASQGRAGDVVISSSANFVPGATWGPFQLVGCHEAAAQQASGHYFGLYPHTVGDHLCLSLAYISPLATEPVAARFLAHVIGALTEACR